MLKKFVHSFIYHLWVIEEKLQSYKNLHLYCQIIQHYFLQYLFKSANI